MFESATARAGNPKPAIHDRSGAAFVGFPTPEMESSSREAGVLVQTGKGIGDNGI